MLESRTGLEFDNIQHWQIQLLAELFFFRGYNRSFLTQEVRTYLMVPMSLFPHLHICAPCLLQHQFTVQICDEGIFLSNAPPLPNTSTNAEHPRGGQVDASKTMFVSKAVLLITSKVAAAIA
jgi:hypothetical protein